MNDKVLIAAFSAMAPFLSALDAHAQSVPAVTGIAGNIQLCEPTTASCSAPASQPASVPLNTIDATDCEANLYYEVPLSIANANASYELEAWAGTQDCTVLANRQTAATAACWPLAPPASVAGASYVLNIRTRDIVSGAFTQAHPVAYTPTTDPSACVAQTSTASSALTLYFFFVDGAGNAVGIAQPYPVQIDLRGGNVQGNISVTPGADELTVNVPATADPDAVGYDVYCDPPPGEEPASPGDSGVATANGCPASSALAPGLPASDAGTSAFGGPGGKYLCATGSATATAIPIGGLKAGVTYDVAVATTDAAGNIGPLSNVACGAPVAGNAEAPGKPGGISCAVSDVRTPAGAPGGLLLVAAALVVGRRRRALASTKGCAGGHRD